MMILAEGPEWANFWGLGNISEISPVILIVLSAMGFSAFPLIYLNFRRISNNKYSESQIRSIKLVVLSLCAMPLIMGFAMSVISKSILPIALLGSMGLGVTIFVYYRLYLEKSQ
ncbi:hypothetical protein KJ780_00720 [Candidatus Micrarchaeota archaeon]|nr:hypothetical protein [Candidatus Micrarchaeota archaeon]